MFDLDEAERIGTSALVHNRIPCDLSTEPAINRFISYAANHWQEMVDELRQLRSGKEWLYNHLDDMNSGAMKGLAKFCEGLAKSVENEDDE